MLQDPQLGAPAPIDDAITSPVLYILSKNLHRRQLTVSQRAAIAAETVPMMAVEAKNEDFLGERLKRLTVKGI
jgi:hypothetical protein